MSQNNGNLHGIFTLQELTKSDTAIRKGIDNNPNADQIEKLKILCEKNFTTGFEIISAESKVTSGFRSHLRCAKP
jgi:hypothetical protein